MLSSHRRGERLTIPGGTTTSRRIPWRRWRLGRRTGPHLCRARRARARVRGVHADDLAADSRHDPGADRLAARRGTGMARIFITGSADGLGRAAARRLVALGHEVVLHGRNRDRAQQALRAVLGARSALEGDLASMEQTRELAA